jgi:hypothetical protein
MSIKAVVPIKLHMDVLFCHQKGSLKKLIFLKEFGDGGEITTMIELIGSWALSSLHTKRRHCATNSGARRQACAKRW